MLEPNKILNEIFIKDAIIIEEIGIYSRARLTIASLLMLKIVKIFQKQINIFIIKIHISEIKLEKINS